jgi:hypothetical protein
MLSVTRLSSRLTVSALALVALAALFGLGAPRPRSAVRDRVARTVVRAGFLRATDQAGAQSGDDHQADTVVTSGDVTHAGRPLAAGPLDARAAAAQGHAAHAPLLDRAAPDVQPAAVATVRPYASVDGAVADDGSGPAAGRAPPAA